MEVWQGSAFRWLVPIAGFRIQQTDELRLVDRPMRQWVLTEGEPAGHAKPYRLTDPLAEPALYRNFADLPVDDPEMILAFANTHGSLGELRPYDAHLPGDPGPRPVRLEFGQTWVESVTLFRVAEEVRGMIRKSDRVGLGRYLRTELTPSEEVPRQRWLFSTYHGRPDDRVQSPRDLVFDRLIGPADVLQVAFDWLLMRVNAGLKAHACPQIGMDPVHGRCLPEFSPRSLLGAMWIQLGNALVANKDFQPCRACGEWFDPSADEGGRTARAVFCSDACKSRDYRRRRDRAVELHAKGMPPKEIVERLKTEMLETELKTVKKWVTKKGGR